MCAVTLHICQVRGSCRCPPTPYEGTFHMVCTGTGTGSPRRPSRRVEVEKPAMCLDQTFPIGFFTWTTLPPQLSFTRARRRRIRAPCVSCCNRRCSVVQRIEIARMVVLARIVSARAVAFRFARSVGESYYKMKECLGALQTTIGTDTLPRSFTRRT